MPEDNCDICQEAENRNRKQPWKAMPVQPPRLKHTAGRDQSRRQHQDLQLMGVQNRVKSTEVVRQQGDARGRARHQSRRHGERRQPTADRVQAHDRCMRQVRPPRRYVTL